LSFNISHILNHLITLLHHENWKELLSCPRHHSQFDITDGHVIRWTDWSGIKLSLGKVLKSPRNLKIYDVMIDGDTLMVDLQ